MDDQQIRQFTYLHTHRAIPSGTRVTTHCGIKHLETMRISLNQYDLLDRFREDPLGYFLKIPLSLHLTAQQLIYNVMVWEVIFPGAPHDEI